MSIGERIRELRKAYGFTQKEVAERSGIATISIQQYERGVRQPRIDQLTKIANALQVPLSHFVDVEPVAIRIVPADEIPEEYKQRDDQFAGTVEYLKSIGYSLSFEIADCGLELYYSLRDIEKNVMYILSEEEVTSLSGSVLRYTKFLLQDMLKEKSPLAALQPPLDSTEGTDTTPPADTSEKPQEDKE